MSDAYRAGKYHAEIDRPSLLHTKTPHTFAWFDYLEGQSAGYNENYWHYARGYAADATKAAYYLAKREEIAAILKAAGR